MRALIILNILSIITFISPCSFAADGKAGPAVHKGVAVFQQGVDGYTGCRDSIKGNTALLRGNQPQAGYTLWWSDLKFDVKQVKVLSARVELNYKYEADYSPAIVDIQCFRSVGGKVAKGKPLDSVSFWGDLVKAPLKPSKTNVYYQWKIPAELVQSWLLDSSKPQGVMFAARAVNDSKKGTFFFTPLPRIPCRRRVSCWKFLIGECGLQLW